MADQILHESANQTFFVMFLFLPRFGFLSHVFGSKIPRKPFKPSKDTDYGLASKKT